MSYLILTEKKSMFKYVFERETFVARAARHGLIRGSLGTGSIKAVKGGQSLAHLAKQNH